MPSVRGQRVFCASWSLWEETAMCENCKLCMQISVWALACGGCGGSGSALPESPSQALLWPCFWHVGLLSRCCTYFGPRSDDIASEEKIRSGSCESVVLCRAGGCRCWIKPLEGASPSIFFVNNIYIYYMYMSVGLLPWWWICYIQLLNISTISYHYHSL